MNRLKHSLWKRVVAIGLSLMVIGCIFVAFHMDAPAQSRFQLLIRQIRGLPPPAPPTGRNAGGSGRGPVCVVAEEDVDTNPSSVLALVPAITQDQARSGDLEEQNNPEMYDLEYVGGYTVSEQPTFWFYLPYISKSSVSQVSGEPRKNPQSDTEDIRVGKFVLLDENNEFVSSYLMAIELLNAPRILAFQLPFTLAPNKLYNWHFSIVCEPDKPSKNPVVRGWVQRVESIPELETTLRLADASEKYIVYAEYGIWFETFSELAKIYRDFPTSFLLQQEWYELLNLVNVENPGEIDLSVTDIVAIKGSTAGIR